MKPSNGKTVWQHPEKKFKPRNLQAALAICCALSVAAIGDVVAAKRHPITRMVCAAVCFFVAGVSVYWFGMIGTQIHLAETYDKELVVSGSIALYVCSAVTSAFCVGVAEK